MEVSELNVFLSDFEAGVNCLQNPSLLSRVPISDLRKLPQFHGLLKWVALVFALIATFTGLIRRIKLLIFRFCKITLLAFCRSPTTQKLEEEVNCVCDDEDDDDSCSVSSSDSDDYVPTNRGSTDEDYCVAGSSCFSRGRELRFRRRTGSFEKLFTWPEFAGGKSVVKLWDSFGLGFGLDDDTDDESSNGVVSIWDLNREEKISSFSDRSLQFPVFSASSPAMIFSAGSGENKKTLLDIYDARMGSRNPAIYAEWQPMDGEVVGISSGGVEKVYVRDDNSGTVTVGDMRNVKAPLTNLTESSGEGWWDADAVILPDDFVDDDLQ